MDRREFLALGPAFPAAAVTATLTVKEDGKEPIALDVNVLKVQAGDVLLLRSADWISADMAARLKAFVETEFPGLRAMVIDRDLKVEGVIRGLPDGAA